MQPKRMLILGIGLWGVAIVVSLLDTGLLNSLLNTFIWLLAFKEAIEILAFISNGGNPLALFPALVAGNSEAVAVVSGWLGLFGWVVTAKAVYDYRIEQGSWRPGVVAFLSIVWPPVSSFAAAGVSWARSGTAD